MIINQHLRNGGQILSVAMPVIQPAFITDKGPNSTLCRPGFAFNKRRLCFNGVWRLSVVQMAAPNCSLFTQTQKRTGKMQVDFSLSKESFRFTWDLPNNTAPRFPKRLQSSVIMWKCLTRSQLGVFFFFSQQILYNSISGGFRSPCKVTGKLPGSLHWQMNRLLPGTGNNIIFFQLTLTHVRKQSEGEMGLALCAPGLMQ